MRRPTSLMSGKLFLSACQVLKGKKSTADNLRQEPTMIQIHPLCNSGKASSVPGEKLLAQQSKFSLTFEEYTVSIKAELIIATITCIAVVPRGF